MNKKFIKLAVLGLFLGGSVTGCVNNSDESVNKGSDQSGCSGQSNCQGKSNPNSGCSGKNGCGS